MDYSLLAAALLLPVKLGVVLGMAGVNVSILVSDCAATVTTESMFLPPTACCCCWSTLHNNI